MDAMHLSSVLSSQAALLVTVNTVDEKLGQSADVCSIVQMSEADLLSGRTNLFRSVWILQDGDHFVRKITLIVRLSQVGIDVVGKEVRKVPNPAGNHWPARCQVFTYLVWKSGNRPIVVRERRQQRSCNLIETGSESAPVNTRADNYIFR
jgi:hypothetical protein